MDGRGSISTDILARYAGDAAREVTGVRGLVESHLHRHRGVRVLEDDGAVRIEVHVEADWGASLPDVGREVQQRLIRLERVAELDEICALLRGQGPPPHWTREGVSSASIAVPGGPIERCARRLRPRLDGHRAREFPSSPWIQFHDCPRFRRRH